MNGTRFIDRRGVNRESCFRSTRSFAQDQTVTTSLSLGDLRVKSFERAFERVTVRRISRVLKLIYDSHTRETERSESALPFALRIREPHRIKIGFAIRRVAIVDLFFDDFALPTSCHILAFLQSCAKIIALTRRM